MILKYNSMGESPKERETPGLAFSDTFVTDETLVSK
jgi:hypothetical protein